MKVFNPYLVRRTVALLTVLLLVAPSYLSASKGSGEEKNKKGVVLKVNGMELKKMYVSPFSLINNGASYKGTLLSPVSPSMPTTPGAPVQSSIITYQKGNTIFIYPVKQPGFFQKFRTPSSK